jgi:hypothetical protein
LANALLLNEIILGMPGVIETLGLTEKTSLSVCDCVTTSQTYGESYHNPPVEVVNLKDIMRRGSEAIQKKVC